MLDVCHPWLLLFLLLGIYYLPAAQDDRCNSWIPIEIFENSTTHYSKAWAWKCSALFLTFKCLQFSACGRRVISKLTFFRIRLRKALYAVHTLQLKPAQLVWCGVVWGMKSEGDRSGWRGEKHQHQTSRMAIFLLCNSQPWFVFHTVHSVISAPATVLYRKDPPPPPSPSQKKKVGGGWFGGGGGGWKREEDGRKEERKRRGLVWAISLGTTCRSAHIKLTLHVLYHATPHKPCRFKLQDDSAQHAVFCCNFSFEIIKFTLPYLTLPYLTLPYTLREVKSLQIILHPQQITAAI